MFTYTENLKYFMDETDAIEPKLSTEMLLALQLILYPSINVIQLNILLYVPYDFSVWE